MLREGAVAGGAVLLGPVEAQARGGWGHRHAEAVASADPMPAWKARRSAGRGLRRLKKPTEQQYAGAVKAQKEGKVALAVTLYLPLAVAPTKAAIAARPSRPRRRWPTKAASR